MKSKCANPRFPADYIVFMRGQCDENNHVCDWIIERTEDAAVVASGTLEQMMSTIEQYLNGRRATWAEDCLRHKPGIFYMDFNWRTGEGEK